MDFSSVALFLLSTTTINTRFPQRFQTYFESRILPVHETWGSFFPHLYFVMGTNHFDYEFLTKRCLLESSIGMNSTEQHENLDVISTSGNGRRRLEAKTKQEVHRDALEMYRCPVYKDPREGFWRSYKSILPLDNLNSPSLLTYRDYQVRKQRGVKVLYTANCTGEYFGIGPTCRNQEAMRYYLYQPEFRDTKWFIFMDDDIYFRPYSLISMLDSIYQNNSINHEPLAILSTVTPRASKSMKYKKDTSFQQISQQCQDIFTPGFYLAQPAIINRQAVQKLRSAIDANGFISLHKNWGGSHDINLGMMLWIYQIQEYSLYRFYFGGLLTVEVMPFINKKYRGLDTFLAFHRVMNFKHYEWLEEEEKYRFKGTIVSQYDIASAVFDNYLYDDSILNSTYFSLLHRQQELIGVLAGRYLIGLENSTISKTRFSQRAEGFPEKYYDFLPGDCFS